MHKMLSLTSYQAIQDRATLLSPTYSFPPVPTSAGQFVAQNLTTRPTFFGCDTTSANDSTPLVIYLANGGPPHNGQAPLTNTPTLQASYSSSQIQAMLAQTFTIATQGYPANTSMTTDPEWPACLACAIVDRARGRSGGTRDGVCESCFARYCWSESTVNQSVNGAGTIKGSRTRWLLTLALAVGIWALI